MKTMWKDVNRRSIEEGDTIKFKYYTQDGMSFSKTAKQGYGIIVYSIPSAQFLVVGKEISIELRHCKECEII